MSEATVLSIVGGFLAFFVLVFIVWFAIPWLRMHAKVKRATAILDEHFRTAQTADSHVVDLERIADQLAFDARISHLWKEFRHTLHAERSDSEVDDYGQSVTVRYRQTVPAELYFSARALIDVPLRTDFFKHLPGILTGLGIIGTFGGLITGLAQFGVSGDANQVNNSVETLIGAVRGAFIVSVIAIALSILLTFIEKMALARLHGRVQRLQTTVDRMFDAGAGEDYLSEIARESEKGATHLAHLKEGLVNDLKHLLDDFAEKQNASTMAAAETMATRVTETLEAPLGTMAAAMERSLEDQQMVVHRLMDQSLDAFAARLEQIVGEKLTDAAGHVETAAGTMRDAMAEVPAQIDAAVAALRSALADAPRQIEVAVARVRAVLDEIAASAEPIAANAERMAGAADHLATTVEQSAETLDYAIGRFKSLGEQIGGSLDSAREISRSLEAGAENARGAAAALAGTGERLEEAQSRLAVVVDALSEVAARAERDGEAHEKLTRAVEQAAVQLSAAQRDVDAFLNGIAGALTETHQTFSRQINQTLDRTHEAFHHNLANATEQLAGTVRNFGDFLETDFKDSVDSLQQEFARLGTPQSHGHNGG
jgi:hypothetical protein